MLKKLLSIFFNLLLSFLFVVGIMLLLFFLSQPSELPKTYQKLVDIPNNDLRSEIVIPVQPLESTIVSDKTCQGIPSLDKALETLNDVSERVKLAETLETCYPKNGQGRNIVIFIDGTGQTGKDMTKATNIWKLYLKAVKHAEQYPIIPFYHEGIGTSWRNHVRGSVAGQGIDLHIKRAYRFLVETYQPEDKIFIFGFSRGAYTARALNGMIEFVGLLKQPASMSSPEIEKITDNLFEFYHQKNDGLPKFEDRLRLFISDEITKKYGQELKFYRSTDTQFIVEAIGVFDTVPALGFERDDYPDDYRVNLYANKGFHALSLDEQRHDFRPLRFSNHQVLGDQLQEVWFAGDHSDVGGGNIDNEDGTVRAGLERISRQWMIEKFADYNVFAAIEAEQSCKSQTSEGCERGKLHDELLSSKYNEGSFGSKAISLIYQSAGLHWRKPRLEDTLHKSVLCRLKVSQLPKATANPYRESNGVYRPGNLYACLEQSYNIADQDYDCVEEIELPKAYNTCPAVLESN